MTPSPAICRPAPVPGLLALTLALVALLATGCGATDGARPVAYGRPAPSTPAPAMEDSSYAPPAAQRSPAAGAEAEPRARAEARDRPGLGTVWGENRRSEVREVAFVRQRGGPEAAVTLYYNDRAGVWAQMRRRGGEQLYPVEQEAPLGGVFVALRDQDGRILPGRRAGGRTYVVGRAGQRYTLFVRNDTGLRFEVVASVDGLDVIDGEPASLAKRGYLVDPHSSLTIDGFRRSDSTVAAFRFGAVGDSYAARTGSARNVGVIGVAFFAEKGARWSEEELRRRETADPFPADPRYAQPPRR